MAKKKVFISYDHDNDAKYRYLLEAWDANTNFEFEFDNRSPHVAINSRDAGAIKSALTKKMKEAEYLLVIVGRQTHKSDWIKWEIQRSKESDVKLKPVAVKLDRSHVSPAGLKNAGTAWTYSFTREGILKALDEAAAAGTPWGWLKSLIGVG